jgi:hypothetical protein
MPRWRRRRRRHESLYYGICTRRLQQLAVQRAQFLEQNIAAFNTDSSQLRLLASPRHRCRLRSTAARARQPALRERFPTISSRSPASAGYLALANDSPPGNMIMWREPSHLPDIALGAIVRLSLQSQLGFRTKTRSIATSSAESVVRNKAVYLAPGARLREP